MAARGGTPAISVIVPAFEAARLLDECLAPLVAMRAAGEIDEILVVDDGSADATAAAAAAHAGVRVIGRTTRGGPGAARNDGAHAARGEWLWFVDADVIVAADAARVLRAALARERPTAVFGSYDDAPAADNFLSQYKNLAHAFYHRQGRRAAATFWAGCGAVERAAFLAVGGFDAARFPEPSVEDIDLGYRLRAAGGTIASEPALRGKHLKRWRLGNLVYTDVFRRALPWAALMLERGAITDDLNVSRGERVRAAVAGAAALAVLLALARVWPAWIALALVALAALLGRQMIAFFCARRGALFALGAFLYHQLAYLYSAAAFAAAWLRHRLGGGRRASP